MRLIIGTEQLGGIDWGGIDAKEQIDLIRRAIAMGFVNYDTASIYGLGLANRNLAELLARIGSARYIDVFGKVGLQAQIPSNSTLRASIRVNLTPSFLETQIKEYKEQFPGLRVLFLHRLPLNRSEISDDTIRYLRSVRKNWELDKLGICNISIPIYEFLRDSLDGIDCVQLEYNPFYVQDDLIQRLRRDRVEIFAYGVLCRGLFSHTILSGNRKFSQGDRRSRLVEFSDYNISRVVAEVMEIFGEIPPDFSRMMISHALNDSALKGVIVGITQRSHLYELNDLIVGGYGNSSPISELFKRLPRLNDKFRYTCA